LVLLVTQLTIAGNRRTNNEINDSVSSASAYLRLTRGLEPNVFLHVEENNQRTYHTRE